MVSMLFVNFCYSRSDVLPHFFLGGFTYTTFHDIVQPGFMFCAGFAYKLVFLRNTTQYGYWSAVRRVFWIRCFALLMVEWMLEGMGPWGDDGWDAVQSLSGKEAILMWFQRGPWQTLSHMAFSMIWIIPVVDKSVAARLGYIILSMILKVYIFISIHRHAEIRDAYQGQSGADGGASNFLSMCIPMLAGTFVYDLSAGSAVSDPSVIKPVSRVFHALTFHHFSYVEYSEYPRFVKMIRFALLFSVSILVCLIGYFLSCFGSFAHFNYCCDINIMHDTRKCVEVSCSQPAMAENPFIYPGRNPFTVWTTSNMFGTPSHAVLSAGLNIFGFSLLYLYNDVLGFEAFSFFRTFGSNTLVAYVFTQKVSNIVESIFPNDTPQTYFFCLAVPWYFLLAWIVQKYFEVNNINIAI